MIDLFALFDASAMWITFSVIIIAMIFYATEWAPLEVVSLGAIIALMALALMAPGSTINPDTLLKGFSNPALFTILALLVIGQGLIQTEALAGVTEKLSSLWTRYPVRVVLVSLVAAGAISSIVNNTPVVVVFIPVLASVLSKRKLPAARYMMPLSYITILGGMTTVLGSSTNLLAAGVAREAGIDEVTFFSFAVPGLAMAAVGGIYVLFVVPRILRDRSTASTDKRSRNTQFITEIQLSATHPLIGESTIAGMFPKMTTMTVRAVRRGRHDFLPPFDDITLQTGDTLILAATREALTEALFDWHMLDETAEVADNPLENSDDDKSFTLCESFVPPSSRLVNNGIDQAGFLAQHGVLILGVERRSRMPRQPLSQIRLESGDVLLIAGKRRALERMRGLQDLVVLEWSASEVKPSGLARRAWIIFLLSVAAIATGLVPAVAASITGAFAMIVAGCLNVRQAGRAIDRKIILLVGSSIAMATAMSATGGANFVANATLSVLGTESPILFMGGLFLVVALFTNLLSNNATAVLFTPVAIAAAEPLGIAALPLIATVILGANASFASPLGYQTNLLVMGAGHYRFKDFLVAGLPLVILVWLVFCLVAPWYYGV